jgi:hypothetical protein
MPNPMLHPKKPKYKTIRSGLDPNLGYREKADFFLRNAVSTRLRQRAKINHWQLFKDVKGEQIITDDSIQTILLGTEPFAMVTRLRDEFNYEFTNFFKPYKSYPHKKIIELMNIIKKQITTKYPKLKEMDFETQTYSIKEYGQSTDKKVHILIKRPSQAVVILYEDHSGTTIFRRV